MTNTTQEPQEPEELRRLRERLERREGRAAVRAQARAARQTRRGEQARARIRREAQLAGEQARTAQAVAQTGEARAMRVAGTQRLALAVLLPVMSAFGVWSASGVQAGLVALLSLDPAGPAALAAWLVEPALLGVVAGIILIRARLESAGGTLPPEASKVEFGALATSIALNMAGHWPSELSGAAVAALAGHALGPIGAAATAYLISLVQQGVAAADPWTLSDGSRAASICDIDLSESTSGSASESTSGSASEAPLRPALDWVRVPPGAVVLPIVSRAVSAPAPAAAESAPRSVPEQAGQPASEAPQKRSQKRAATPRTDRGSRVPAAAKSALGERSPRALTDEEMAERLRALRASGELPQSAPVRQVQTALGVGFARAKRVLTLADERTETVLSAA